MKSALPSETPVLPDSDAPVSTNTDRDSLTVPRDVWIVSVVVVVGAFMTQLDAAFVNIGLKTVASDLHSTLQTTQWIVSAYLLALVIGLPLCSWTARRIGAGRLWLGALAAFTIFSAACALSPTIQALIASRVAQGFAGGMLLPAGMTVIAQAAGRNRMGRVMSVVGTALVLAPALGPILGSLTLAHLPWPWLFLINLPIGVIGLRLGRRIIPRGERENTARFDSPGFLLVGGALPLITYAISRTGRNSDLTSGAFYVPLLLGALALVVFARRSRRVAGPLLKVSLFSQRTFLAAAGLSLLVGLISFGALVLWPLYLQIVRGYGLVASGLAMLGFAVGSTPLPISGRLTDKFGGGRVCLFGTVLMAGACVPIALADRNSSLLVLEASLVLLGLGTAFCIIPAFTAANVAVDPSDIPDSVTLTNILLRLGGAVGTSMLVAIIGSQTSPTTATLTHFRAAFWTLSVFCLLSFLMAVALTRAESVDRTATRPIRTTRTPALSPSGATS
jgi:EmrB/QacA subfamily drug resistance transporter